LVLLIVSFVLSFAPSLGQWLLAFVFVLGLCVFAFAMRWDGQDLERKTRKSDVAFWLHLLAAPLIVHPVFASLGINGFESGLGSGLIAGLAILIYLVLGVAAVIVDRRAVLVSALIYVIVAIGYLFSQIGPSSSFMAFAILLIGSGLLVLSAFWQNLRRFLFRFVPTSWHARLPPIAVAGALAR
jgi:hypothetical protein